MRLGGLPEGASQVSAAVHGAATVAEHVASVPALAYVAAGAPADIMLEMAGYGLWGTGCCREKSHLCPLQHTSRQVATLEVQA